VVDFEDCGIGIAAEAGVEGDASGVRVASSQMKRRSSRGSLAKLVKLLLESIETSTGRWEDVMVGWAINAWIDMLQNGKEV
jgi:hypothetical protein